MVPENYRPRTHDHLVEPMFGGLGVDKPPDPTPSERAEAQRRGTLASFGSALARLVSRLFRREEKDDPNRGR